jgi:hypothetical protein
LESSFGIEEREVHRKSIVFEVEQIIEIAPCLVLVAAGIGNVNQGEQTLQFLLDRL